MQVTIDIKIGMPFQYKSKTYYVVDIRKYYPHRFSTDWRYRDMYELVYVIAQKSKKSKSGWKKQKTVTFARLKEIIATGK